MGNRFPSQAQFEWFTEVFSRKFKGKPGFSPNQMNNWMIHLMIQCHNLSILMSHPPCARSKDVMLEFIVNFKPANKRVWIKGKYQPITPKIIAEALQCGHYHHFDEQTYRKWIKEYKSEVAV